jgi:hypothetical protein
MKERPAIRPSGWYGLLAVPFLLGGISIFIYGLVYGISHVTDSLTQVAVPGESRLELKRGQSYTVFLERQSVVNGKIYSTTDSVSRLECNLVTVSGVQKIEMRPATMSTNYDVGGRSGHSMFEFRVPNDGVYDFACGYRGVSAGPEVVVAVGSGVGEAIMRTISVSLAGMFGGVAIAGGIVLAVFLLRVRSKKKAATAGFAAGL